jgi:hypothetical protein
VDGLVGFLSLVNLCLVFFARYDIRAAVNADNGVGWPAFATRRARFI